MTYYLTNLIPHSVIMRMTAEDVASAYQARLSVDDIKILLPGSLPVPGHLWARPPGDDRDNFIWYFCEEVDGVRKLLSTGCRLGDLDGAKAFVLRRWVRAGERARARLAPESIPVCEVLDAFLGYNDEWLAGGDIKPTTHLAYQFAVKRCAECYGTASVMDVQAGGSGVLMDWGTAQGYAKSTIKYATNVLKRAVNVFMERAGSAFRLTFRVGTAKGKPKKPFTPDELDRIVDVVENDHVYGADLKLLMVEDPVTGKVRPATAPLARQRAHVPFARAVHLMVDGGHRPSMMCEATWDDDDGPRIDIDSGIFYRRAEMSEDPDIKSREPCLMSPEMIERAKEWREADIDAGHTHVIRDWQGNPVWGLRREAWVAILEDANVRYRKFYTLKDVAVQISRAERIRIHDASERFAITPETMKEKYGAGWDLGNAIDPAAAHGAQVNWRRNHAMAKDRTETAAAAKARREAEATAQATALPPARRAPKLKRAGRRPQGSDVKAARTRMAARAAGKPVNPKTDEAAS